jgi:hypothetical protein
MSHFTVLVIGPDIEKQLQPFHEYECTGTDDEYVVDVDITDEVLTTFNEPLNVVILTNGTVLDIYDDNLYITVTDPTLPSPFNTKRVLRLPDGATKGTIPADQARLHGIGYMTLAACAQESHGAEERDGRFYLRTNPNSKWDWWLIGGRWTGAFKLKPGAKGIVGKPGTMTEPAPPGYADQALKGDIDFEQMRNDEEVKARARHRLCRQITGGAIWDSWEDTCIRYPDIDVARTEYHDQPAVVALHASKHEEFRFELDDELALDEAIYVQRKRDRACVYFAFVRDSIWTERGKMGWWADVSDEISKPQWDAMFNQMLDELPDDTLLTVVDCHI